ncbi:hypothetical protein ACHAXA_010059 [Cyclostephanos tholiformis]|uniref:Uncharacterized protein n=1 Tax=Cyclostephanos tholiformis TaxID=382380 RepID=A0ABD3SF54_9STRA
MKRVKSKNQNSKAPPELSFFSLEAAISEARATTETQTSVVSSSPRKLLSAASSLLGRKNFPSQQSLATNASFATANENSVQPNDIATPAASYFYSVDDDDDEIDDGSNFGNDPLAVLSRTETAISASRTPTEISFSIENPEETMPSKKKSGTTIRPTAAVAVETPSMDPPPPVAAETAPVAEDNEPHFDVVQTIYGATKDAWAWGKTVAVISNVLDLTEAVALKALDVTVHMDLVVIDDKIKPQLKKLDDEVVTPAIMAVWKVVEPALGKAEEMVLKPVMTEVVPRVLGPLGFGSEVSNKEEEKKTAMIDMSPTPEIVPAFN